MCVCVHTPSQLGNLFSRGSTFHLVVNQQPRQVASFCNWNNEDAKSGTLVTLRIQSLFLHHPPFTLFFSSSFPLVLSAIFNSLNVSESVYKCHVSPPLLFCHVTRTNGRAVRQACDCFSGIVASFCTGALYQPQRGTCETFVVANYAKNVITEWFKLALFKGGARERVHVPRFPFSVE